MAAQKEPCGVKKPENPTIIAQCGVLDVFSVSNRHLAISLFCYRRHVNISLLAPRWEVHLVVYTVKR